MDVIHEYDSALNVAATNLDEKMNSKFRIHDSISKEHAQLVRNVDERPAEFWSCNDLRVET